MKPEARIEKAIKWLSEQKEALKSLRNASTRDPEFKQWRQATLTYIQRIWPGDEKRPGRFRRVPFSPPSSRADRHETRIAYEKGFAEAVKLIEIFVAEIEENGLPEGEGNGAPPALEWNMSGDDVPTIELPEDEARQGSATAPDLPRLRAKAKQKRKRPRKKGPRKRLKDMLGFSDAETCSDIDSETPRPPENPADEVTVTEPVDEAEASKVSDEASAAQPVEDAPSSEVEAGASGTPEESPAPEPAIAEEPEPAAVDEADEPEEDFGDFLNASPVFQSANRARKAGSRQAPASATEPAPVPADGPANEPAEKTAAEQPHLRTLESPGAIALSALAAEVERLGVPESKQERTRAALHDLAELLDAGELSWEGLRGAVDFAMEHPAVARRVLPLLIPYLDRAA